MSQEASIAQAVVAEAAAAETPVAEVAATPIPAPEPDISTQFAELKKKEREARAERNNVKRELEDAKRSWEANLKKDPLGTLRAYGITSDSIASALLEPEVKEVAAPAYDVEMKAKLDRLEAERQERMLMDFRKDVFSKVESDPDNFELLLNTGNGKDMYMKAVVDYYQAFNEAPDYLELAQEIESALLKDAQKLLSLKKLKPAVVEPKAPTVVADSAKSIDTKEFVTLSKKLTPDASGRKTRVTSVQDVVARTQNQTREQLRQSLINKYLKD